jgi:hypothetical protein
LVRAIYWPPTSIAGIGTSRSPHPFEPLTTWPGAVIQPSRGGGGCPRRAVRVRAG